MIVNKPDKPNLHAVHASGLSDMSECTVNLATSDDNGLCFKHVLFQQPGYQGMHATQVTFGCNLNKKDALVVMVYVINGTDMLAFGLARNIFDEI